MITSRGRCVCVVHGNGVDLFRITKVEGLGNATFERRTFPPPDQPIYSEEIRMTGDLVRHTEIRLKHPKLDSEFVLVERVGGDAAEAARVASVASLFRDWARKPSD